jgi:hypothetical protein
MNIRSRPVRILSTVLYLAGLVIGVTFLGLFVWANIEATLFDPALTGDEALRTLQCPMIITEDEVASIRVTINNPLDREIERIVRMHISEGMITMKRQENQRVSLSPGETMTLEWTAYPEDAAFDRLILVRGYIFRTAPLPARSGSCGIVVVNVPGMTGNQISVLAAVGGFLFMGIGSFLWVRSNQIGRQGKERHLAQGMVWLFGLITIGIILAFFSLWQLAFLFLFITVVLMLGLITYVLLGY